MNTLEEKMLYVNESRGGKSGMEVEVDEGTVGECVRTTDVG